MFQISCPLGHTLEIGQEHLGQRLMCPKCQAVVHVSTAKPGEIPSVKYEVQCAQGHVLRVKQKYLGKEIRCPSCQQLVSMKPSRLLNAHGVALKVASPHFFKKKPRINVPQQAPPPPAPPPKPPITVAKVKPPKPAPPSAPLPPVVKARIRTPSDSQRIPPLPSQSNPFDSDFINSIASPPAPSAPPVQQAAQPLPSIFELNLASEEFKPISEQFVMEQQKKRADQQVVQAKVAKPEPDHSPLPVPESLASFKAPVTSEPPLQAVSVPQLDPLPVSESLAFFKAPVASEPPQQAVPETMERDEPAAVEEQKTQLVEEPVPASVEDELPSPQTHLEEQIPLELPALSEPVALEELEATHVQEELIETPLPEPEAQLEEQVAIELPAINEPDPVEEPAQTSVLEEQIEAELPAPQTHLEEQTAFEPPAISEPEAVEVVASSVQEELTEALLPEPQAHLEEQVDSEPSFESVPVAVEEPTEPSVQEEQAEPEASFEEPLPPSLQEERAEPEITEPQALLEEQIELEPSAVDEPETIQEEPIEETANILEELPEPEVPVEEAVGIELPDATLPQAVEQAVAVEEPTPPNLQEEQAEPELPEPQTQLEEHVELEPSAVSEPLAIQEEAVAETASSSEEPQATELEAQLEEQLYLESVAASEPTALEEVASEDHEPASMEVVVAAATSPDPVEQIDELPVPESASELVDTQNTADETHHSTPDDYIEPKPVSSADEQTFLNLTVPPEISEPSAPVALEPIPESLTLINDPPTVLDRSELKPVVMVPPPPSEPTLIDSPKPEDQDEFLDLSALFPGIPDQASKAPADPPLLDEHLEFHDEPEPRLLVHPPSEDMQDPLHVPVPLSAPPTIIEDDFEFEVIDTQFNLELKESGIDAPKAERPPPKTPGGSGRIPPPPPRSIPEPPPPRSSGGQGRSSGPPPPRFVPEPPPLSEGNKRKSGMRKSTPSAGTRSGMRSPSELHMKKAPPAPKPTHVANDVIQIICPNGHQLEVESQFRDNQIQCPLCLLVFMIPSS